MSIKSTSFFVLLFMFFLFYTGCGDNDNPGVDGDSTEDDGSEITEDGDLEGSDGDSDNLTDGDNDGQTDGDSEIEADGDTEAEIDFEYPDEPENRVVYDMYGPSNVNDKDHYNRLPYPYNYFTVEDESTRTGIKLKLSKANGSSYSNYIPYNTNMIDRGIFLLSNNEDAMLDALNTLDGFSTFGAIYVEIEPDVDESMLPQTPEDSVKDDSLVYVLNIDKNSDDFGKKVPVWVKKEEAIKFIDQTNYEHVYWYLEIRPYTAFDEITTYALVIENGLKTPDGDLLESSIDFRVVSALYPNLEKLENFKHLKPEVARLKPVMETLTSEEIGLAKEDLLLAVDFKTQSVTSDLTYIEQKYRNGEYISPDPVFTEIDIDTPQKISSGSANIGAVIQGTFKAADFRLPRDYEENEHRMRSFAYDENNNPVVQDSIDIPFTLILPDDAEKQPFPVVIAQHGIFSSRGAVTFLASTFAEKGYATIVMDFVYHGDREEKGQGMPPLEFIDVSYPLKTRASFVQSSADQFQLIHMLKTWDEYTNTKDVFPKDGDGKVDLDMEHLAYFGHSLGSIVGSTTIPVSHDLNAGVINVGGGGLTDYLQGFLAYWGLATVYPPYYFNQFATAIQTILDGGDSVNFTKLLKVDGVSKKILIQESIDDDTVPNAVTANYAKAVGAPHLNPVFKSVYGLEVVDGPVNSYGYQQFDPACHNSLNDSDCGVQGGEATYGLTKQSMQDQLVHFIETYIETGTAEIKVPLHAESSE